MAKPVDSAQSGLFRFVDLIAAKKLNDNIVACCCSPDVAGHCTGMPINAQVEQSNLAGATTVGMCKTEGLGAV